MLRLFYRQRRRIGIGGFFATLGLMMMVHARMGLGTLPVDAPWIMVLAIVLTALFVFACYVMLSALWILLFPNLRNLVEMLGVILFVIGALPLLIPGLFDIPYIGGFIPVIFCFLIPALMYGEVLDRFRIWVDYKTTRSFHSPKSAEELWEEMVPGAGPTEAHWDSLLHALEPDPEEDDSFEAEYMLGHSLFEHQTMTFLDRSAPHHARYHHVGDVNPKNKSLVEGTYEVLITPQDTGGCIVTFRAQRSLLLLRIALTMWFDDHLGDQVDHLRARHFEARDWSMTGRFRRKITNYA